jgi:hypothetical protein
VTTAHKDSDAEKTILLAEKISPIVGLEVAENVGSGKSPECLLPPRNINDGVFRGDETIKEDVQSSTSSSISQSCDSLRDKFQAVPITTKSPSTVVFPGYSAAVFDEHSDASGPEDLSLQRDEGELKH